MNCDASRRSVSWLAKTNIQAGLVFIKVLGNLRDNLRGAPSRGFLRAPSWHSLAVYAATLALTTPTSGGATGLTPSTTDSTTTVVSTADTTAASSSSTAAATTRGPATEAAT